MLIILSIRCYDAQTSEVMIEPGAMQASILPSACRERVEKQILCCMFEHGKLFHKMSGEASKELFFLQAGGVVS